MSVNFFSLRLGVAPAPHSTGSRSSFLKERWEFIRQFFESPETVGSLFPSSQALAKTITKYIPEEKERASQQPLRILEVGAGSGVFTEEIIRKMSDKDEFDVVEINPKFCEMLKKKYALSTKKINIHQKPIEEWKPAAPYDCIISGLPLNIFKAEAVAEILERFKLLAKKDAKLAYFEYILIPRIYRKFLKNFSPKKENLLKIQELKKKFFENFGFQKAIVELNWPPARVLYFNMPGAGEPTRA